MMPSTAPGDQTPHEPSGAEATTSTAPEQAPPQAPPQASPPLKKRAGILGGILDPLRYRNYRLLFVGQLVSGIGDGFYEVALPWLILSHAGGASALGLVMGAYAVTRAGTTIAGGWLSDRIRPRRVMLIADVARMLLIAALALAAMTGHTELGVLCVLIAGLGIFSGAFIPASFAITPDLLPADALGAGNSLTGTYASLAALVGPVLAGVVIASGGTSTALVVDAVTFLVSAVTLSAMRQGTRQGTRGTAPASEGERFPEGATAAGAAAEAVEPTPSFWRFVAGSQIFQLVLLKIIAINLVLGGVIGVGIPSLAHGPLHAGADGYGVMIAVWGAGALIGGLSGAWVARLPHQGMLTLVIPALQGLAIVSLPVIGVLPGAFVSLAVMGLCNGVGNVVAITFVQRHLPPSLMGRMMGAISFGNFGLTPLSVVVVGFAVARFGPSPVLMAGGALSALVMLLAGIPRALREA